MGCASLILLLLLNTLVPSLTGSCCDVAQTHPALVSVRKLASSGEAGPECLHLWELLECSICDPRIGVQSGPPVICASFCDRVFEACAEAYYSTDEITQVLAPCGVNDYVCGRASECIRNGTEFCHAAGFAVKDDVSVSKEEAFCYGGKASLDLIADSWKASPSEVLQKAESFRLLEEFQQRWREMPFSERVSWAVGGLVLTAGLLFVSKRKRRSQRHNVAALRIRKFEAKISQKSPNSPRSRKKQVKDVFLVRKTFSYKKFVAPLLFCEHVLVLAFLHLHSSQAIDRRYDPNTSPVHSIGRSDGRCVQRAGT